MSNVSLFRAWLASRFLSSLAKQIQALVVMWQIYELTRSPLALGMVGFAEAVPYILVGLWGGHAADRYEKRRLILLSESGLFLCAMGLLALSRQPSPAVLPIYIVLGVASMVSSFELPASSSYIQMIIPKEEFPRAAAWNLTQYQIATIAGPILGGILLSQFNAAAGFTVVAALSLCSFLLSLRLKRIAAQDRDPGESPWMGIKEGLRFLTGKRIIFACMVVDMLAVLFGDVIAILPVFAGLLSVGPIGLGFLRAAPAFGSCITSIIEAQRAFVPIKWKTLLHVVVVFGVSMICFAASGNFYLALFFLAVGGIADGMSVIIRQSIYQANTPDHLRGRVASVSGIFIRISNELGGFESGLAASLFGAVPSVYFGGGITLLVALVMWRLYPDLLVEPKAAG